MNVDPTNMSFALPAASVDTQLMSLAGGRVLLDVVKAAYPLADFGAVVELQPSLAVSTAGTDVVFACPALTFSNRVKAQGSPIWMYEFRDANAIPSVGNTPTGAYYLSFPQGAAHSYELQYVFNLRDLQKDERKALQTSMTLYWTNFARTGDPNQGTPPAVAWPAFTGNDKVLGLDVTGTGGGIAPLATFAESHKCTTAWSALTF
jgi:para-nitrobenzyl esterase